MAGPGAGLKVATPRPPADIDSRDRMIVALDRPTPEAAMEVVVRLGDVASFYKIGMELIYAGGLGLLERLVARGKKVFLDTKLLDIVNSVAGAVRSLADSGAVMATVHAYPAAMRAAVAAKPAGSDLALLGVTVLTSMDDADIAAAGYAGTVRDLVARRAADARAAGIDGIVASATEAAEIRRVVGPDLLIVTPGIRPAGAEAEDQKRVATPAAAIAAGADYLVVGRAITSSDDPAGAAENILHGIEAGLAAR